MITCPLRITLISGWLADRFGRKPLSTKGGVGGGLYHSQTNTTWFAHEPGLVVVAPGTVADAKPEYEYRESVAKSQAVLQAIAVAVGQADWP